MAGNVCHRLSILWRHKSGSLTWYAWIGLAWWLICENRKKNAIKSNVEQNGLRQPTDKRSLRWTKNRLNAIPFWFPRWREGGRWSARQWVEQRSPRFWCIKSRKPLSHQKSDVIRWANRASIRSNGQPSALSEISISTSDRISSEAVCCTIDRPETEPNSDDSIECVSTWTSTQ